MFKKFRDYLKEDKWYLISLIIIFIICNVKLPYYINMPGGIIKINNRIQCNDCKEINGSLNMLYVTEYVATVPMYLVSYLVNDWDRESIEAYQVNDESVEDINTRNKLMLENSIDNATYVAYKEANRDIKVRDKKTFVATTFITSDLKIGDQILKVEGKDIEDVYEIREVIDSKNVGDKINLLIKRNNKEKNVSVEIKEEKGTKLIGVLIITDYDYEVSPEINFMFRKSESGASGGLMMALSMYVKIIDEDIIKGRNIAGTGTISQDGTVGAIDGIKYKIIGAYKNNIDVVLVPSGNYKEAMEVVKKKKYNIKLVEVKTFKDAIEYLKNS